MSDKIPEALTTGQVSELFGISSWKVSRIYGQGDLPAPLYCGRTRVILRDDLPKVKEALEKRGYLKRAPFAGLLAT